MIVEFVGRSGVGKTAIAKKVSECLEGRGFRHETEDSIPPRKLAVRNTLAIVPALSLTLRLVRPEPRDRIDACKKLARAMARNAQWVHQSRYPLINSENLFQVIGYLRTRGRLAATPRRSAEALSLLPVRFLPNLVVQVVASPEKMAERRGLHRSGAHPEFERELARTDPIPGILTELQPLLEARGHSFRWIQVNNDLPEDFIRCVSQVENEVQAFAKSLP